MDCGLIGQIVTPASGNRLGAGRAWCADNAAFTGGYPGDDAYLAWLTERLPMAADCAFAVAPDVPFDAAGTLAKSAPMLPRIRALGYPVALCAQDGLEDLAIPWDDFDVLFIAGSTEWKLSPAAALITYQAKARGKWVHMGRVNSWRRLKYAAAIGCDSCDGTYLAFGPDVNLPRLLTWLDKADGQLPWGHGLAAGHRLDGQPRCPIFFVPADTSTKKGVRDCAICPLGEDRQDVHTMPPAPPEQAAHRARIGERD